MGVVVIFYMPKSVNVLTILKKYHSKDVKKYKSSIDRFCPKMLLLEQWFEMWFFFLLINGEKTFQSSLPFTKKKKKTNTEEENIINWRLLVLE